MKLYIFPILTALSIISRMLIILTLGGAGIFGMYSLVVSIVTVCTVLIQVYRNQAILVKIINMSSIDKDRILKSLLLIGIASSLFWGLLIISFGKWFDQMNNLISYNYWSYAIFSAILLSFIVSVSDIRTLSEGKLMFYYSCNAISTFSSVIFSYLIITFYSSDLIVFIPTISSFFALLYYTVIHKYYKKTRVTKKLFETDMYGVYKLIKETWQMNVISLNSVFFDYIVKSVYLIELGATGLGHFQTVISIESMTGNIFLGTYYRKILLEFSTKTAVTNNILKKILAIIILLSFIPIIGISSILVIKHLLPINQDLSLVLFPLLIISILKFPWYMWGGLGQILIAKGYHVFVSIGEVLIKASSSILLILLLYFLKIGLWSYVTAIGIICVFLIIVNLLIITNKMPQINLYQNKG